MTFTIEFDTEVDGRIIASVPELPGVHVYGTDHAEARSLVVNLAEQVIADLQPSDL